MLGGYKPRSLYCLPETRAGSVRAKKPGTGDADRTCRRTGFRSHRRPHTGTERNNKPLDLTQRCARAAARCWRWTRPRFGELQDAHCARVHATRCQASEVSQQATPQKRDIPNFTVGQRGTWNVQQRLRVSPDPLSALRYRELCCSPRGGTSGDAKPCSQDIRRH
jgi:hypothetical protein